MAQSKGYPNEAKQFDGLAMYIRPGTSDESAAQEVIVKRAYERKYFKVEPGDNWVDLGGNIGAFTVWAIRQGATVTTYEPDPASCQMIRMNLAANGMNADLQQAGVVGDGRNAGFLSISKTGKFWRNSLYKEWGGGNIKVPLVRFDDVIASTDCVKMDIEGAEMDIIEKMTIFPRKLVLEWSFDIDDRIPRYRAAVTRLQNHYPNVKFDKIAERHTVWQKSWFPPAKMIYAWR